MCVRPKLRLLISIPSPQSRTFFPAFRHGFAAVAGVAKALQILSVREHRPVPVVRDDVVHLRGPGSAARISWRIPNRTLPAKRLSQELSGAQFVCPFRRGVHPAPGSGRLAAACSVFGLMRCAVSARHQGAASWVPARPQGLLCHGLSPPGKTKEPGPTRPHCGSCGSGSLAQAQIDVQKSLPLAMAAIGIGPNFAVRWEPEELHRLAHRADDPSIR